MPYCYRIYKDFVNYEKAKKMCSQDGGDIAPSASSFDLDFAVDVGRYYLKNDECKNDLCQCFLIYLLNTFFTLQLGGYLPADLKPCFFSLTMYNTVNP